MVDPSITDDDREAFLLKLRVGFALLVGVSMAMVSFHVEAELPVIGAALLGGTSVGAALAWWAIPESMVMGPAGRRGRP